MLGLLPRSGGPPMSTIIPFTDNYRDLSNDRGYQFEFVCERCGNGYRSPFKTDKMELGKNLFQGLGRLTGGKIMELGYASDSILDRSTNSPAKDKALGEAVDVVRDQFRQCRGCGNWVCEPVCWNHDAGQCLSCSPSVVDEISRAQAAAQVDQIRRKATETDWTEDLNVATRATAKCPSCGATAEGGKFCAECGASLQPTKHCTNCGVELKERVKFCPDCGQAT